MSPYGNTGEEEDWLCLAQALSSLLIIIIVIIIIIIVIIIIVVVVVVDPLRPTDLGERTIRLSALWALFWGQGQGLIHFFQFDRVYSRLDHFEHEAGVDCFPAWPGLSGA